LYKDFKSSLDIDMYLDILPNKFITVLSRLRSSSHQHSLVVYGSVF